MLGKPLLILDLDETLIHATARRSVCDFRLGSRSVVLRPGVGDFLCEARRHFELAVWTARTAGYAGRVLRELPDIPLAFVWTVSACHQALDSTGRRRWFKDLQQVRSAGFPLDLMAILDDAPERLISHGCHVLPISSFTGATDDDALLRWTPRLSELAASLLMPSRRVSE